MNFFLYCFVLFHSVRKMKTIIQTTPIADINNNNHTKIFPNLTMLYWQFPTWEEGEIPWDINY